MNKGKKIFTFVLINILVIIVTVVMPFIPAVKFYNVYHYEDIPSNITEETRNVFFNCFKTVVNDLKTQDGKEAFSQALGIMMFDRGDILYNNFVWMYIMFGIMLGVLIITLGIVLKYKCENKIYSRAFIAAGVIVIIAYIFFLSILLQRDVFYSYF